MRTHHPEIGTCTTCLGPSNEQECPGPEDGTLFVFDYGFYESWGFSNLRGDIRRRHGVVPGAYQPWKSFALKWVLGELDQHLFTRQEKHQVLNFWIVDETLNPRPNSGYVDVGGKGDKFRQALAKAIVYDKPVRFSKPWYFLGCLNIVLPEVQETWTKTENNTNLKFTFNEGVFNDQ